MPPPDWIVPDWSAPSHVRAISTTRSGGCSEGIYRSMNPATHVKDNVNAVTENRKILQRELGLSQQPQWLQQYHSTKIIDLDLDQRHGNADGSTTTRAGTTCVVMTADCLPVLLTDRKGNRIMAIHAGWRGLAGGIIEAGLRRFAENDDVIAWMGPAIGAEQFEVGAEVIEQLSTDDKNDSTWYKNSTVSNKYLVDMYMLATIRLLRAGAVEVTGGDYCTFSEEKRFFSYRRQGDCGRMATLIWLDHQGGGGQTLPS